MMRIDRGGAFGEGSALDLLRLIVFGLTTQCFSLSHKCLAISDIVLFRHSDGLSSSSYLFCLDKALLGISSVELCQQCCYIPS